MATKLDSLHLEISHFDNVRSYLPGIERQDKRTIDWALSLGLFQVSTAVEIAIATHGDNDVVSADQYDLSDGTEVKYTTARWHGRGFDTYGAKVSNTKNKDGALRVQVLEPMNEKFYYFFIPYEAHSKIGKNSNIEIPFTSRGEPKRSYQPKFLPNWWNYEVASFEELCLVKA